MYKTVEEACRFVTEVNGIIPQDGVEAVICAPYTALASLTELANDRPLKIGAQNMHWETEGAFTGEISPVMLKDIGVKYVIIGHSERREYFKETDETVNKKVLSAFQYDLTPILCVGERLEEREAGRTEEIIKRQTEAALQGVTAEQCVRLVIAYEPVWAIGTGKSSTAEDANQQIAYIRKTAAALYDENVAEQIRILYGGSVKPENIDGFMAQPDIDGALVGGASLQTGSFLKLVEAAAKGRNV